MSQRKIVKRAGETNENMPRIKVSRTDVHDGTSSQHSTTVQHQPELKLLFAPNRYLVYSRFNDRDNIHIREYGVKTIAIGMGDCEYPTKKWVCFTPGRLKVLRNKIEEIDEQLSRKSPLTDYKAHLGAGIYVTIGEFNCVDIRRHWIPEGHTEIIPTKRGITLSPSQWRSFKEKLGELLTIHPTLGAAEECFHQNQMGHIECYECSPFGWLS